MRYTMRVAIAFDQPANTVRVGQPDEMARKHLPKTYAKEAGQ